MHKIKLNHLPRFMLNKALSPAIFCFSFFLSSPSSLFLPPLFSLCHLTWKLWVRRPQRWAHVGTIGPAHTHTHTNRGQFLPSFFFFFFHFESDISLASRVGWASHPHAPWTHIRNTRADESCSSSSSYRFWVYGPSLSASRLSCVLHSISSRSYPIFISPWTCQMRERMSTGQVGRRNKIDFIIYIYIIHKFNIKFQSFSNLRE